MSNVKGPDEAQNPDFEKLVAQYQGCAAQVSAGRDAPASGGRSCSLSGRN